MYAPYQVIWQRAEDRPDLALLWFSKFLHPIFVQPTRNYELPSHVWTFVLPD